jgi:hypothetical protein
MNVSKKPMSSKQSPLEERGRWVDAERGEGERSDIGSAEE